MALQYLCRFVLHKLRDDLGGDEVAEGFAGLEALFFLKQEPITNQYQYCDQTGQHRCEHRHNEAAVSKNPDAEPVIRCHDAQRQQQGLPGGQQRENQSDGQANEREYQQHLFGRGLNQEPLG